MEEIWRGREGNKLKEIAIASRGGGDRSRIWTLKWHASSGGADINVRFGEEC